LIVELLLAVLLVLNEYLGFIEWYFDNFSIIESLEIQNSFKYIINWQILEFCTISQNFATTNLINTSHNPKNITSYTNISNNFLRQPKTLKMIFKTEKILTWFFCLQTFASSRKLSSIGIKLFFFLLYSHSRSHFIELLRWSNFYFFVFFLYFLYFFYFDLTEPKDKKRLRKS
jgi:hypothetical protein